jgi:hypothetical protein
MSGDARPLRSSAGQHQRPPSPDQPLGSSRLGEAEISDIPHNFEFGKICWFQYLLVGSQGISQYYAGKLTAILADTLTWQWCDSPGKARRRISEELQQASAQVSDPKMTHLMEDSSYSKAQVEHLLTTQGPALYQC